MKEGDKMKSNVVYIYNLAQANFYMQKGIKPLDVGIHDVTNKTWFKFDYYETQLAYSEWCYNQKKH